MKEDKIISLKKGKVSLFVMVGTSLFYTSVNAQALKGDSIKHKNIDEVIILGNRSGGRTSTESTVPVDVFNIKENSLVIPQTNINQILNSVAPSFTSNTQTNAGGTDHSDPAQLRGLGPDQILVLVNGKRRHTSALVNVNGSPGRGSVGTDLNAIPSFAVSKIEILRDGAAAQYGSDAISGVMNLQLKRDIGKLSGQINYGGHLTPTAKDHTGKWDGESVQLDLNYGNKIGNEGGFYNVTFSTQHREPTNRAGIEDGKIYNAYNAIEKRALEAGDNLSTYFSNIDDLKNSTKEGEFIDRIKDYSDKVDYFDDYFKEQIKNAGNITSLQNLLKDTDYTDQELAYRNKSRRDFNMWVGQSRLTQYQFFVNSEIPIDESWKAYAFGGYSNRVGISKGFYRRPHEARTFTGLHIDGYLPEINFKIQDISVSAGLKGVWNDWKIDLSNTFGQNSFDNRVRGTGNTSMKFNSPSDFNDGGGVKFSQNTVNLDLDRNFDILLGLNFALGGEYRREFYKLNSGSADSYSTYDVDGVPIIDFHSKQKKNTDFFGRPLPGGAQVGSSREKDENESRASYAAYADLEVNFTDWLLSDAAIRYENYSDFGNTLNYKVASRVKLNQNLNIRFAGSTGFRAPSVHQIYYNDKTSLFVDGELKEVGTFRNDSEVAKLLGIPELKEETSRSVSAGITYKLPSVNLAFTADAYWIGIKDRVVLTEQFNRPKNQDNSPGKAAIREIFDKFYINAAQFFANSIDTETKGIDIVISHNIKYSNFSLKNDFAFNINKSKRAGNIHSSEILRDAGLEDLYFGERSRLYLEEGVPKPKASLSHLVNTGKIDIYIRNTYYGKVTGLVTSNPIVRQVMTDRVLTDLSLGYGFSKNISITVGANNLFDIFPSKNVKLANNNDQFIYTRSTAQFGMNGRFLFSRLNFNF